MSHRNRISAYLLICAVTAAAFAIGTVSAQPKSDAASTTPVEPSKIATLDLVTVFGECAMIRDLNSVFNEIRQRLQDEAAARAREVEDAETKVQAFRPGSADYETARREALRKRIEFNSWFEAVRTEVKADEFRWMIEAYNMSSEVTAFIAEKKGLDLVALTEPFSPDVAQGELQNLQAQIRSRKIIYRRDQLDITNVVIDEMNRRYQARGGRSALSDSLPRISTGTPNPAPAQPTNQTPVTP